MFFRRRRSFCATALLACCLFTAQVVRADVIVLRTGERMQGTIANRVQLAAAPETFSQVALLGDAGDPDRDLHRFHALSIDFVILEDESGDTVIDFMELYAHEPLRALPDEAENRKNQKSQGVVLMTLGLAIGITGALFPFGEPKGSVYTTVYPGRAGTGNDTYNGANYAMMIGGGVLTLAGIATMVSPPSTEPKRGWNMSLSERYRRNNDPFLPPSCP